PGTGNLALRPAPMQAGANESRSATKAAYALASPRCRLIASRSIMNDERFEALVGRLEGEAKRNPGSYRTRVLLMALLGNFYLGVVLTLIVALLLGAAV